jgi:hypothetical protein
LDVVLSVPPSRALLASADVDVCDLTVVRECTELILGDIQLQSRLLGREQATIVVGWIGQERAPEMNYSQTSPA